MNRPSGWAFFVGLLQAAYTLTGYGMVASMCEEVQNPHREVPKAIVLSVAAAGITGGCGAGKFCPAGGVTRGQMAAFLHRAFGK